MDTEKDRKDGLTAESRVLSTRTPKAPKGKDKRKNRRKREDRKNNKG